MIYQSHRFFRAQTAGAVALFCCLNLVALDAKSTPSDEPAILEEEDISPAMEPMADPGASDIDAEEESDVPQEPFDEAEPEAESVEDASLSFNPEVLNDQSGDPESEHENTRSISGNYLAMQFARSQGDKETAIAYLKGVLGKDPKNNALTGQLMVMNLLAGNVEDAIEQANVLIKSPDHELITEMLLAINQVHNEDFKGASATLKEAFDVGFGSLWLPLVSAWLDLGQGKIKKPLTLEDVAPKAGSIAPLVYYHIGLINDLAGFHDEALENLRSAVQDRTNIPFRVMQALSYQYRSRGEAQEFDSLVALFREVYPELAFTLQSEEIIGVKPTVSNVQEGVAEVLFTMASILFTADVEQDTLLYLRLALYLRPDFPSAQMILGSLLEEGGDFEASNEVYESILPTSPFHTRARLRSAMNLDRMDRTDEAISQLDAMANEGEGHYDALVAKGDVLRGRNRLKEAADAYSQALSRVEKPTRSHWAIYFARGSCYERLSDWDNAEADLKKALELNPNQPDVLNYLGYSWLTRGKHIPKAKRLLEKAISARPNDAHIIDSMGWALYNLGDYNNAVSYLERAIELMPGDATINEHLGDAYWQAGRKTEAKFQWERSLVYSPDPEQEAAIRDKLQDGLPETGVPVPQTAKQQVPEAIKQQ